MKDQREMKFKKKLFYKLFLVKQIVIKKTCSKP